MSEIVDKALALMLRHAANEAKDYGDVRPATGFGPVVVRFDKESKTFGSTPLRTKLSDLAKQVSLTGHRPHRRTNPPARATHRHCPPNPCVSTEQHVGIFAESYQTPNIASRRKLVRFIFEEMKGELLLCDEAWELENGPGNHLLLIDRCLKNQVRKRNKEVEAESDRLLRHR